MSDLIRITPLSVDLTGSVRDLLELGAPFVRVRGDSDYWLYASLFADTCPIAVDRGQVVGVALGFQSQVNPADLYIQDVMVHPEHRGRGVARELIATLAHTGRRRGCTRLYLTSEPDNAVAHRTWIGLGFTNVPGDRIERGVQVIADCKGPGRDRAVYDLDLTEPDGTP